MMQELHLPRHGYDSSLPSRCFLMVLKIDIRWNDQLCETLALSELMFDLLHLLASINLNRKEVNGGQALWLRSACEMIPPSEGELWIHKCIHK